QVRHAKQHAIGAPAKVPAKGADTKLVAVLGLLVNLDAGGEQASDETGFFEVPTVPQSRHAAVCVHAVLALAPTRRSLQRPVPAICNSACTLAAYNAGAQVRAVTVFARAVGVAHVWQHLPQIDAVSATA